MKLIFYSKPECHLCAALLEKLQKINDLDLEIEIRDITTRSDWFEEYQYEIPVLFFEQIRDNKKIHTLIPRPSPRATPEQIKKILIRCQEST